MPTTAENWIGGLGTAAGLALAEKGYSDLGEIGERAYGEFTGEGGLADVLSDRLKFQPYTVTTATGSDFGMMENRELHCLMVLLSLEKWTTS